MRNWLIASAIAYALIVVCFGIWGVYNTGTLEALARIHVVVLNAHWYIPVLLALILGAIYSGIAKLVSAVRNA